MPVSTRVSSETGWSTFLPSQNRYADFENMIPFRQGEPPARTSLLYLWSSLDQVGIQPVALNFLFGLKEIPPPKTNSANPNTTGIVQDKYMPL